MSETNNKTKRAPMNYMSVSLFCSRVITAAYVVDDRDAYVDNFYDTIIDKFKGTRVHPNVSNLDIDVIDPKDANKIKGGHLKFVFFNKITLVIGDKESLDSLKNLYNVKAHYINLSERKDLVDKNIKDYLDFVMLAETDDRSWTYSEYAHIRTTANARSSEDFFKVINSSDIDLYVQCVSSDAYLDTPLGVAMTIIDCIKDSDYTEKLWPRLGTELEWEFNIILVKLDHNMLLIGRTSDLLHMLNIVPTGSVSIPIVGMDYSDSIQGIVDDILKDEHEKMKRAKEDAEAEESEDEDDSKE